MELVLNLRLCTMGCNHQAIVWYKTVAEKNRIKLSIFTQYFSGYDAHQIAHW